MSAALPRTVLVTGAARRLGRDIAVGLAAAGWQVAVHYRESAQAAQEAVAECAAQAGNSGAQFACFQADLTHETQARALLPQVVERLGRVDAVVNNAALFLHDDAHSFSYEALARHLALNTAAPLVLAQALHAQACAAGHNGVVVNLLDQKLWNPNPDFISYTLSKAALEAATTLLAQALAPQVRVVGVAPGLTLDSPWLTAEKFKQLHQLSPLGRSSTPADVMSAVKFALDNPAVTGTTLLVDGGQHLMRFERDFSMM